MSQQAIVPVLDRSFERDRPVSGAFVASVDFVQPDIEELKRRFKAFVNPDFAVAKFEGTEPCKDVLRGSRQLAFQYVHLGQTASTKVVLAEMRRKRVRPALYEELLGFALRYPEEQEKHAVIALGSVAMVRAFPRIACAWQDHRGRTLCLPSVGYDWDEKDRFLAVKT